MNAPSPSAGGPVAIPRVVPAPGSRLEQLRAARADAAARRDAVKAELDAITADIKGELTALYPGRAVIDLDGGPHGKPLRCSYRPGKWTVDGARLKKEYLPLWNLYATQGRPYWDLRELTGGES